MGFTVPMGKKLRLVCFPNERAENFNPWIIRFWRCEKALVDHLCDTHLLTNEQVKIISEMDLSHLAVFNYLHYYYRIHYHPLQFTFLCITSFCDLLVNFDRFFLSFSTFLVMKKSFLRHLLAVWEECRILETMQSGFEETFFPFAPDVKCSTVSKPETPTPTINLDARDRSLLQIGKLIECLGIKESDCQVLLDAVTRAIRQQSIRDEVATALFTALLPAAFVKNCGKSTLV